MTIDTQQICQYYYYIAVFSTIIFAIKLAIFTFAGADTEVVTDFNAEIDTDISFNFFSIQSILAFFMGFGWMGYAGIKQFGMSTAQHLTVSILVGLVFMIITSSLFFMVKKLEKNVKKDKATAVNHTGKAYTTFAPKGNGQIEIEINGQLTVCDAINESEEEIKAFENIKVRKLEDDKFYIEKV